MSRQPKKDIDAQIRAKYFRAKIRNKHETSLLDRLNMCAERRTIFELEGHMKVSKEMVEAYRRCRLSTGHCPDGVEPDKEDIQGFLVEMKQFTNPWSYSSNHTIESWSEQENMRRQKEKAKLARPRTSASAPSQPDAKMIRHMFLQQTIRPKTAATLMMERAKEEAARKVECLKLRPMSTTNAYRHNGGPMSARSSSPDRICLSPNAKLAPEETPPSPETPNKMPAEVKGISAKFNLPKSYTPSQRLVDFLKKSQKPKEKQTPTPTPSPRKQKMTKHTPKLPVHMEVDEEVTISESGLPRRSIESMLKSIDRLPIEEPESSTSGQAQQCMDRAAIENLLRPGVEEPGSAEQKADNDKLSECQSFDSVSQVSSEGVLSRPVSQGTPNQQGDLSRSEAVNQQDSHSRPTSKGPPNKKRVPSRPSSRGAPNMQATLSRPTSRGAPSNKTKNNDTETKEDPGSVSSAVHLLDRLLAEPDPDMPVRMSRPQCYVPSEPDPPEPAVEEVKKPLPALRSSTVGRQSYPRDVLAMDPVLSSSEDEDNETPVKPPKEKMPSKPNSAKVMAKSNLKRRGLNKSKKVGTFHATSIITKENDKELTNMNMRSLENPAFLASLTLEQHEALQEKLERRKKSPEERLRIYVHPELRHRKEEMFLMKRHMLLQRQNVMPGHPGVPQDGVVGQKIHIIFSSSMKKLALEFLTRENTAKVMSQKLQNDEGDLQERVQQFLIKMDECIMKDKNLNSMAFAQ